VPLLLVVELICRAHFILNCHSSTSA